MKAFGRLMRFTGLKCDLSCRGRWFRGFCFGFRAQTNVGNLRLDIIKSVGVTDMLEFNPVITTTLVPQRGVGSRNGP